MIKREDLIVGSFYLVKLGENSFLAKLMAIDTIDANIANTANDIVFFSTMVFNPRASSKTEEFFLHDCHEENFIRKVSVRKARSIIKPALARYKNFLKQ